MESATADPHARRAERILVYDDDRVLLDLLGLVLSREGYDVTSTVSEQEAIACGSTRPFDVAIADLGLRRSNGYRLVRMISEESPETGIVAISAYPASEVVRFAREHARAFLDKPFALRDLVDVVRSTLAEGLKENAAGRDAFVAGEVSELRSGGAND